ncbi:hypothetical protein Y032_0035g3126 [Ancylostoma ceylanicum]|uniref:Uncharacterized protein n=1 Tax=Ancylostoma ceylanicum TaxID=53326 RepID=A0A016UNM0_9BILA|nr:hypothetical protein Y032_0035g3126 [Ancylostoma ceylanicum]
MNAIIAKMNFVAERRRRLQVSRPVTSFSDEERKCHQGNLQLLTPGTPAMNSNTRCMELSDVLEELHDARLPEIPMESIRFHVYEILRNATAAFNGTCREHLPNPANATLREDINSLTCNFPCKKYRTRSHNLNQHLINKYKSHLLYPTRHS